MTRLSSTRSAARGTCSVLTRRLLSSTSFRLSAIYSGLVVLSFLIAAFGAWMSTRNAALNDAEKRLEVSQQALAPGRQALISGPLLETTTTRLRRDLVFWRLVDSAGETIAGDPVVPASIMRLGVIELQDYEDFHPPGDYAVLTYRLADGTQLSVAENIERTETIRDAVLLPLLWVGVLSLVASIGAGILITRRTLARMDRLAGAVHTFGAGNLGMRAEERTTNSPDDIDQLVIAFNQMLSRIDFLVNNVRRVSADVAHDLRTPLTHVRQRLEGALEVGNRDNHAKAIESALASIDDLLRVFDAMLRLAEIESGTMIARFVDIDLTEIVERVADAYRPDIETSGRTLQLQLETRVHVAGDADLLAQAVANLLENAMRHTPPTSAIAIRIERSAAGAILSVADNGVGIPAASREWVLEPFKRLDESRRLPGSGLGLSIVAGIARLHRARLSLEDARPGLLARIVFD